MATYNGDKQNHGSAANGLIDDAPDTKTTHTDSVRFSGGMVWAWADIKANVLQGTEGNDYLQGNDGEQNTLFGLGGDDTLVGGNLDDTLIGGTGNDRLMGNGGNDIYLFAKGDGFDIVNNYDADGGVDIVKFTDSAATDITRITRHGDNLEVYGTGCRVYVSEYFAGTAYRIDQFQFSDGVIWTWDDIVPMLLLGTRYSDNLYGYADKPNQLSGKNGDDKLYGGNVADILNGGADNDVLFGYSGDDLLIGGDGNDTLYGGDGNDTLKGGLGNDIIEDSNGSDTYLFSKGDGVDSLANYGNGRFTDIVKFTDVASAGVSVSQNKGLLQIDYGVGDRLTVQGYFFSNVYYSISQFRFSDGVVWNAADILLKVSPPTEGNDTLKGVDDAKNVLSGLGGNDKLYGGNLADTLDGGAGNDRLYGQGGNDVLLGGDGRDYLDGGTGNDVLNGGKGDDSLYGGSDSDAYLFAAGDGLDSLVDAGGIADRITFTDVTSAQVKVSRVASGDLLLAYGTQDLLTVTSYFLTANGSVEQFRLSDGVVWKWGDIARKVLQGTEGDDYLQGYDGKHAHLLGLGGNDTIYGGNLADKLEGGEGNDALYGGYGDDLLNGGAGNDSLNGSAGNDVLRGGMGNDSLYGGDGNNTYLFAKGDGLDTINATNASIRKDGVVFTDIVLADLTVISQSGADLVLGYGTNDQLTVLNHFSGNQYKIDRFNFTDTSVAHIVIGDTAGAALAGSGLNDLLVATAGSESLAGGLGNDWYWLDDSGDTVTEAADAGRDTVISSVSYTLAANVENLVLKGTAQTGTGNALANRVNGNAADNTLNGGAGNDVLFGKDGNDLLSGGEGADVLSGGLGHDIIILAETVAATDTVKIAAADSLITGFDTVTRFGLGDGLSTVGTDRLDLAAVNIAADVAAADGVNVGGLKSHSISNGIVSFGDTDSYAGALTLNSVGTALDYLKANLTGGITVAFSALGSTYLFQDGGATDTDTVVQLLGVEAANLNTTGLVSGGVWLG